MSELGDFLHSGYYESPLGYDNVDWFAGEVMKLEYYLTFYIKNTNKFIAMTKEEEEHYLNYNVFRFCEKDIYSSKVRDQGPLNV